MKFKSRGLRTSAVMVLRGSAGVGRAVRGGRAAGAAGRAGAAACGAGAGCCRSGLRGRRDRSRDRSHRHGLGNGPCGRRRSSCGRSRRGGFLGCGFGSASRLASSLFLGTQASLLLGALTLLFLAATLLSLALAGFLSLASTLRCSLFLNLAAGFLLTALGIGEGSGAGIALLHAQCPKHNAGSRPLGGTRDRGSGRRHTGRRSDRLRFANGSGRCRPDDTALHSLDHDLLGSGHGRSSDAPFPARSGASRTAASRGVVPASCRPDYSYRSFSPNPEGFHRPVNRQTAVRRVKSVSSSSCRVEAVCPARA